MTERSTELWTLHKLKLHSFQRRRECDIIMFMYIYLDENRTNGDKYRCHYGTIDGTLLHIVCNRELKNQKPSTIPSRKYNNSTCASIVKLAAWISGFMRRIKI